MKEILMHFTNATKKKKKLFDIRVLPINSIQIIDE